MEETTQYFDKILNRLKGTTQAILNLTLKTVTALLADKNFVEYETSGVEVIALNDDGTTYSKVPNMIIGLTNGFEVSNGTLIKTVGNTKFLIVGTSDLEVNKAVTTTYTLWLNGIPIAGQQTRHTFTSAAKITTIAITAIAEIVLGDEIEIRVKGDGIATSVIITIDSLNVTFTEI